MADTVLKTPLWLRIIFGLLANLPIAVIEMFGVLLGYLFYYLDKRHRAVVLRNLARVFPEKSKHEREQLAKRTFIQNGRTVMEIPFVFSASKQQLLSHVEVEGEAVLKAALAEGKGVFLMATHFSNWELMGLLPSMLGYQTSTLYRPLNQKSFDMFTFNARTRFGTQMFDRNKGLRWLFTALKENQCIITALDQHMGAGRGIMAPFLGHVASTTSLPVPFVHKNKTPLVGMALQRIDHTFKFKLKFWRIETPETTDDKSYNNTAVMSAACASFDDVIKSNPEQWLWMHRRWQEVETDEDMRDKN